MGSSAHEGALGAVSTARSSDATQDDNHEGERGYYTGQLVSTRFPEIVRFRARTKESRQTLRER